jgi:sec-independent protein translocase protein TatA
MGISFWHIIIVVLVVVLLFGAGKIPRLMKDLGSGITAFKKGLKQDEPGEPGAREEGRGSRPPHLTIAARHGGGNARRTRA